MPSFFGKYRGRVANVNDPLSLARLQVQVPAVLGEALAWALPSVPCAGNKVGFLSLPSVGAHVWVEFEGGDTNSPIWSGCFWASGELPTVQASQSETAFWITPHAEIQLSPTGIDMTTKKSDAVLKLSTPQSKIEVSPTGIEINMGGNLYALKVTPNGISLEGGRGAKIFLSVNGIEINGNGAPIKIATGAASIEMSAVSVNINKGALEVL